METPTINTMVLIREIRDKHYQYLQNKPREERIAFYRERAQKIQEEIPALLANKTSSPLSKIETPT